MEYREIVAVTGIGGLFQLLATKSDGAIVRNLTDKSVKFIPARVHNVTPIESIEIYTIEDNVRLHKVLQAIKDAEAAATAPVDPKKADNNAIKAYFKAVYPSLDEERVYVSDMKKILKWYELLKENDLLNFEEPQEATAEEAPVAEEAVAAEAAPAKKATKKAAAAETAEDATEEAAKPAKKARAKKSTDEAAAGEEKPAKKAAPKKKKTEE